ncbi:putative N-ethylmaleimide reductase [Xylariales sp. PMI_506]|nr:putative N-ethylmaleimide reductase [Xylariales sp. PMI_506]
MVTGGHPRADVCRNTSSGTKFRFISVQNPAEPKDRKAQSLARSHAVTQALKNKRRYQQESGQNFRVTTLEDNTGRRLRNDAPMHHIFASPLSLFGSVLENVHMIVTKSTKLKNLVHRHQKPVLFDTSYSQLISPKSTETNRQAIEPIFTVGDELVLQNFHTVLQTSTNDVAFLSAIMLTYVFAITGKFDYDCLTYQSQALKSIRTRMESPDKATSESTLAAIILLAGIEAQLRIPFNVQFHMGAIQQLLNISETRGVLLSDEIKRAIFWQDLNSAVMVGSSRIVDHTTFVELHWKRDPCTPNAFVLPPGFEKRSHLLTAEFIEVLKDIHALQCIRDHARFGAEDKISMRQIDNHQASIQSRLVGLPTVSCFLDCCQLGVYLCSALLRCKLWPASVISPHLSSQLLRKLQQANSYSVWNGHFDVIMWLLHVGGAFSPSKDIRSGYAALLVLNRKSDLEGILQSWPKVYKVLKQFIWSDKAFMSHVKSFWEELQNRVGMPSLTRCRATDDHVPTILMKEYYSQRAAVPGTIILAEGTFISTTWGGFPNGPGLWNNEQVEAWRVITDEVHHKGCFIICQLFAMGRVSDPEVARREGVPIFGPSAIPFENDAPVPRAMTTKEIRATIEDFAEAAKNALRAGFDGVECHAANGYLIDQFIQDVSNKRTDEYGGCLENRSRFAIEVLQVLVDTVGPERVGLRLSPWSTFQGMRMEDPIPQFTDIINKASQLGIAYLHLIESRISGAGDYEGNDRLDFAYDLWKGPLLIAGGYTPEEARKLVDSDHPDKEIVVMFGRYFISNPDLVFRIKEGLTLSPYDRETFYTQGSPAGYLDYPFSTEYRANHKI